MTKPFAICVWALALALGGCVTRSHRENAALTMRWPAPPAAGIAADARPDATYPSVGGDVLKGSSLADLAAARAAAVQPVDPADKPN